MTSWPRAPLAKEMEAAMNCYHSDQKFILSLTGFVNTNDPKVTEKMQPSFLGLVQDIGADLGSKKAALSGQDVLKSSVDKLFAMFSERWAEFGKKMIKFMSKAANDGSDFSVSDISAGAFRTPAEMDQCFRMRARYMLTIFDTMATGPSRITAQDFSSAVETMTQAGDSVAFADLITNKGEWVALWESILKHTQDGDLTSFLRQYINEKTAEQVETVEAAKTDSQQSEGHQDSKDEATETEKPKKSLQ